MRIAIYLTVQDLDQAVKIAEALHPWREKIIQTCRSQELKNTTARYRRYERILTAMPTTPMNIGTLWRGLRVRRLYGESYKTFQRDVYDLIANGRLIGTKQRGYGGRTTVISTPEDPR